MSDRMSDSEAVMWAVEKDPALRSDFCNLTLLEHTPPRARLQEKLATALDAIPRLRQKVVSAPLRIVPPEWVDDPDLDLGYHVRAVAAPEPGGERELLDLAASLADTPFDRSRPLWEFTIIEGLEGGRAALLQKVHHTITDGVGALKLSLSLVDFEPDPAPADEPQADVVDMRDSTTTRGGRVVDGARMATSMRRQLLVTDRARSDVIDGRSLRRRFELFELSLPELKKAAARLGGTVNDVYVTGLTGALRRYHLARGSDCTE